MRIKDLLVPLLTTLNLVGVSGAASSDKRDATVTPDLKTLYPVPLQIVLRQPETSTTLFEAEVYNHNVKPIKVLKFGSFFHGNDVALKMADVVHQDKPVPFLGVTPLLNFDNLRKQDFVKIKSGESIKVKFDIAEHFDLSVGETFTIKMKGTLPVSGLDTANLAGYIPYISNPIEFKVDRRAAEWTRMKYLDRMPKVLHQNCKGGKWDREHKIRQALSECVRLAGQGKRAARNGPAWRMEEAFGSSSQQTREHVISVFSEAEKRCMHDSHKVDQICAEYYGECLSNRKIVTSYLHEPTLQVGYCDEFFWLADVPKKCNAYDTPKAWGWHSSRSSTVVRQMIQSSFRQTMGANASLHTEHGLARILALDIDQSLKNADNYELFATHYNLDCDAVSPPRPTSSSPSLHHERDIDYSTVFWKPCNAHFLSAVDLRGWSGAPIHCATVKAPLDYKSEAGKMIDLHLVRLQATKGHVAQAKSVLINPGGPGKSGIDALSGLGAEIYDVLEGKFNVIGFDPRGTGQTLPFDCSGNLHLGRRSDETRWPLIDPWLQLKDHHWPQFGHLADNCFILQQDVGQYIGTVSTVRDMLTIVDALEEDGQLRYWGVSYGTVLGQVFASMFPDRVGRMVLDGNVMADNYIIDAGTKAYRNTERAFDHLIDQCYKEKQFCPLRHLAPNAAQFRMEWDDIFKRLLEVSTLDPDSILDPSKLPKVKVDIVRELKNVITSGLYSLDGFGDIAVAIEKVWEHSPRSLAQTLEVLQGLNTGAPTSKGWDRGIDAFSGIQCSDSPSFRTDSPEGLYSSMRAHLSQSTFGETSGLKELHCARWKFDAIEAIDITLLQRVKTANPVLLVNGMYDPVTPLDSAWDVSSRLDGSRVLVHDGIGHGVIEHPSKCTYAAIRNYFMRGTMPELGTVCKADIQPFWQLDRNNKRGVGPRL